MAKVGIKDVAAKAGVSTATVSHALRNPNRVAASTREKVLAAVEEIGYTPNNLGVSLRTAKSGNIVAIIPDITDSHNSGIINAIEKVARQHGYSVLLGNSQGSEQREREFAMMTASRQADGIILLSHRLPFKLSSDRPNLDELPPLVNGCEPLGIDGIASVTIDDKKAGYDAAEHLIHYGHTRIAAITGDMRSPSSINRLAGFKQAMRDAKIPFDDSQIITEDYSMQGGERGVRQLLMLKNRPTAICCFSDEIALGAMARLRQNGLSVPEDVSVIGFDGIEFGRYSNPPLTTIAQPASEIGETCAKLLIRLLAGEKLDKFEYTLPHTLKIRGSTRPIQR